MVTFRRSSRHQTLMLSGILSALAICFLYGGYVLSAHQGIFTSRWLIERIIIALPVHFLISLRATAKQKESHLWLFFGGLGLIITCLLIITKQFSQVGVLLAFCRSLVGRGLYFLQKKWLTTRRSWSSRQYIQSHISLRSVILSILTTISLISTLGKAGIDCLQIEQSLYMSGIKKKFTTLSVGKFFGITENTTGTSLQTIPIDSPISGGVLGFMSHTTSQIYQLITQQQSLLNHSLCELVNTQLKSMQDLPRRHIAGTLLVYVLLRPLIYLLVLIGMPFWMIIWNLLIWMGWLKRYTESVKIHGIALE